jgi:hypothetical protein
MCAAERAVEGGAAAIVRGGDRGGGLAGEIEPVAGAASSTGSW